MTRCSGSREEHDEMHDEMTRLMVEGGTARKLDGELQALKQRLESAPR